MGPVLSDPNPPKDVAIKTVVRHVQANGVCSMITADIGGMQDSACETLPMKLTLLGTTGYHPNDRRHTLCLLLADHGIMLDAGTGMYRAARYLQTAQLDIFLTHAHLDHVIGLTYLFDVIRQHPLDRITVHGAEDKLAAIGEHLFAESLFPAMPPCEFRTLAPQVSLPDGGRLTHFQLAHPGGAVGYRLDWPGHSMAYVTDTTAAADADYVDRIRGVDLLIHECYFSDESAEWAAKTGHSCTTPVAEVARRADVGRLVLVHQNPLCDEKDVVGIDTARAIFANTELGDDLMEIVF
jgi:ribonuclease Z